MIKANKLVSIGGWLLAISILLLSGCGLNIQPSPTPAPEASAASPGSAALALEPSARLPRQLKFEPFSLPPELQARSILQDHHGFLWLGSEEALYRFDGYNFKPYTPASQAQPAVALPEARRLYEDRLGRLWAVTQDDLVRFDPDSLSWTSYRQGAGLDRLGSNPITGLAEDLSGILWVSTDGGGLFRLEPGSGQVSHYVNRPSDPSSLSNDGVLALVPGLDGQLWLSTRAGGLDRLDPATGLFTHFEIPRGLPDSAGRTIHAIVVDPGGDLWLAVKGGLLGFDPQLGSFTFFSHPAPESGDDLPTALVLDPSGYFWLGTNGAGLYRFSPQNGEWVHYQNDSNDAYSLSQDQVSGLLLDRTGILWIQFHSGDVDRFDPRAGFRSYQQERGNPNSLSGDTVTSILVDSDGNWWIGTLDSGLNRYEPRAGRWTRFRHDPNRPNSLSDDQVTALAEDEFGRIWVGTLSNGLNRFDPESGRWTVYTTGPDATNAPSDKSIRSLLAGQDGRIWVGAGDGILNQLEPETGRFRQLPLPDPLNQPGDPNRISLGITALIEDPGKSLWLGTESGQLFRFDLRSDTWKSYSVPAVPGGEKAAAPVASMWVEDGLVWIGTQQNGLVRFDPASETFKQFTEVDGLPGMNISGILGDGQGALWLSTENGLVQFIPATGTALVFHTADGLPAENFVGGAAFRSPGGELFFGSEAGLLAFYPESVRPNPYLPPVVITDFQLLYEVVPPGPASPWRRTNQGDEIHLGYSQNVFTIEYAALDFANPGANQYAYQLVGFDPDWVEAGPRRQASYTSLEPGDYVFRVRGSNNAGAWNEAGVSIPVVIQPPFWLTGWFRLLAVGLVLVMVTSGVGLRLRAVNRQKRELVRQVEQRTAELKQALQELEASREVAERAAVLEERQRLARELHDSVTQLLYGQVLSADISHKYLQKGDLKALGENLVRLREIAGQSLKEMRLLLYELRPTSFEEEGLVQALDLRLDAVERRSRIESALEVKGQVDLPPQVAWEVYRVAIEALNNSLKHAAATEVTIRLCRENGAVQLEVQDNGRGFEVDGSEKGGFGILSMRQRAEGIGGRLAIESNPGQGTCVKLEIPVNREDNLEQGGQA